MTTSSFKPNLMVTAKLALCGASIAAIAWAVGVFGPDGRVAESQADITWLTPMPRSNTAQFMEALDRLGHEPPRMFEINGNLTYFSTRYSDLEPWELVREYQAEFVRQGLNPRAFNTIENDGSDDMLVASMTGSVVPLAISRNHVAMGGMLTQNRARNREELRALNEIEKNPHRLFRAHRFIEINRDEGARQSLVTATWSDENFDYEKMIASNRLEGQNPDPEVPACPGCTRLQRFVDLDPDHLYESNVFIGPLGLESTRMFYDDALRRRGWEPADVSRAMFIARRYVDVPNTESDAVQYMRGREFLTLTFFPDNEGHLTTVAIRTN